MFKGASAYWALQNHLVNFGRSLDPEKSKFILPNNYLTPKSSFSPIV